MNAKSFVHIIFTAVFFAIITGYSTRVKAEKSTCNTRYPIVLVHGVGFRDQVGIFSYWNEIPEALKKNGATVYLGGHDAFGAYEHNAGLLKQRILEILQESQIEKVNIIAHSKGGLDSRYMISKLGMGGKVASLTTIATPHHGSAMADILLARLPNKEFSAKIINRLSKLMGDKNPTSFVAGQGLSPTYMIQFNKEVPDIQGVYYQSYGGSIDRTYPNLLWRKMQSILYEIEGENDGLVSVRSCQWGEFKGIVRHDGKPLVSHADIVGLNTITKVYEFKAAAFYISVVRELKAAGF